MRVMIFRLFCPSAVSCPSDALGRHAHKNGDNIGPRITCHSLLYINTPFGAGSKTPCSVAVGGPRRCRPAHTVSQSSRRDGLRSVLRRQVQPSVGRVEPGAGVRDGGEKHAARRVRRPVQLRHVVAGRHYLYVRPGIIL